MSKTSSKLSKYDNAVFDLKCALDLSQSADDIPVHILVCKAVALLNMQWDIMAKTQIRRKKMLLEEFKNDKNKYLLKKNGIIRHDTRHFYSKDAKRSYMSYGIAKKKNVQSSKRSEEVENTYNDLPPIDWNLDNEDDTNDIDMNLRHETERKLGIQMIKSEDLSNELTNDWTMTDSFSMICDDVDFDVPLEMPFESDFI